LEDDKLVVGTKMGEIHYIDNFEEKQKIENAYNTGGFGTGPVGEDGKV
jgi:coenzyme F420-reducing hydrogenase delta subunit